MKNARDQPENQRVHESENRPHAQEKQQANRQHPQQRRPDSPGHKFSNALHDGQCLIVVALWNQGKHGSKNRAGIH